MATITQELKSGRRYFLYRAKPSFVRRLICRFLLGLAYPAPDSKSNVFKQNFCNETLTKMHRVLVIGKGSSKPQVILSTVRQLV